MLAQRYQLGALEGWQDFLWTLKLSEGSGLSVIFLLVPDASAEPICREALTRQLAGRGQTLKPLIASTPEELRRLALPLLESDPAPGELIWVAAEGPQTEALASAWRFVLMRLNESRNALYSRVPVPLIFCGPDTLRTYCWESAPDLWSIRAGVIEIILPPELAPAHSVTLATPTPMQNFGYNGDPALPLEEAERLRLIPGAERPRLRNLIRASEGLMNRYQWELAQGVLHEAESLARKHGTPQQRVEIAWSIGVTHQMRSQLRQAAVWYQEGAVLAKTENIPVWEANCIAGLASIHLRKSELDEAEARYQEAIPKFKTAGNPIGEANCIAGLASIHLRKSELDEAEARYQEAIPIYQSAGATLGEANCIKGLADIHLRKSELDEAEARYQEAIPKFKTAGDPIGEANCIYSLGDIRFRSRHWEQARSFYETALPMFQSAGAVTGEANIRERLAVLAWNLGQLEMAKAQLLQAKERWEAFQLPAPIAYIYYLLSCFPDTQETQAAYRKQAELLAKEYLDAGQWEAILKEIEALVPEGTPIREL